MKFRILAAILGLCGLAAVAVYWINRDPLSRLTEPTGYTYAGIDLFDTETGKPAMLEDYGFLAPMFAEMAEALAQAAQQGYLMIDPDARTASLVALGMTATASLPASGQQTAFNSVGSGGGPIFLTYSRKEDRFIVRAPETALDAGLDFRLRFERAEDDLSDRIAAQDKLRVEREAVLAQWNGEMDKLQAQLPPAVEEPGPVTYRQILPGDLGTIAAPVTAALDPPQGDGFHLLNDRATGRKWMGIRLDTKDDLNRIFTANRKELLDPPSDDTRLLYEDDETMVVARRGKPMFFERFVTLGDMGYIVRAAPKDGAQLATIWQIANSITDAPPDPDAIPSQDFDALSWFAEQGLDLDIGRDAFTEQSDKFAERLSVEGLLTRSPELRRTVGLIPVAQLGDPFAGAFKANLVCAPRLLTGDSPTAMHEEFSSNPVFSGLAHRDMGLDHIAAWVAQKAYLPDATFEFDPSKHRPDPGDPIWSLQSPQAAIGADKLSYFAYRARDLGGQFQLICASSSDNPYAAQAALQIAERHELPDLSGIAPEIARIFGDYEYAALIGDTVYEARRSGSDSRLLVGADGSVISDVPFDWSWEFDDLRLFETGNLQGKHALWSFEGEQLLPYEYDEIDDNSDGTISVYKDGDEQIYSPSSPTLEPAAP